MFHSSTIWLSAYSHTEAPEYYYFEECLSLNILLMSHCPLTHDHWSHCPGMTETMTLHDMSRHVTRDTSHMMDPIED